MRCLVFAALVVLEMLTLVFMLTSWRISGNRMEPIRRENRQLVKDLGLTDLALWTGARYTRHLSQADLFSAFQDSMGALEHFPEGSLATLPEPVRSPELTVYKGARHEPAS